MIATRFLRRLVDMNDIATGDSGTQGLNKLDRVGKKRVLYVSDEARTA